MGDNERPFQDWLENEIDKRRVSNTRFSEEMEVSPSNLARVLDRRNPQRPSAEFLGALAKNMHVSLTRLVQLAYPELSREAPDRVVSELLVEQIQSLPDSYRDAAETMVKALIERAKSNQADEEVSGGERGGVGGGE